MTSLNFVIIGSSKDVSPVRRLAINWIIADLLPIEPLRINFGEIIIANQTFFSTKIYMKMWSENISASMC